MYLYMHVYTHIEKSKNIEGIEFFSLFSYQQKKKWSILWGEDFYYHCVGLDNILGSNARLRLGIVATKTITSSSAGFHCPGGKKTKPNYEIFWVIYRSELF